MPVDPSAYARETLRIIAERDQLAGEALASVRTALEGARKDVMDRLAALSEKDEGTWTEAQLRTAKASIEGAMKDLGIELSDALTNGATTALEQGAGMTAAAVRVAGDEALAARIAFGRLTGNQAAAIARHYPALVKGMTDRATDSMGRTIQRGLLTGRPATRIMADIRTYLAVPERPEDKFGGLYYQTERIFITETNRIFAAGTEMGHARAAEVMGGQGLIRVWQHSGGGRYPRDMHVKLHGASVPYPDGMFDVNGNPAPYPHHASLPAGEVIYCRCGALLWNAAWGPAAFGAFPPGSDGAKGEGAFERA